MDMMGNSKKGGIVKSKLERKKANVALSWNIQAMSSPPRTCPTTANCSHSLLINLSGNVTCHNLKTKVKLCHHELSNPFTGKRIWAGGHFCCRSVPRRPAYILILKRSIVGCVPATCIHILYLFTQLHSHAHTHIHIHTDRLVISVTLIHSYFSVPHLRL